MAKLDRFQPPTFAEVDRQERRQAIMDEEDARAKDTDDLIAQLIEDKRQLRSQIARLTAENQQLTKHLYGK